MSELPKAWAVVSLAEIASDISYGFTDKATMQPVGPKFLRITDIQEGRVNWSSVPHCRSRDGAIGQYSLKAGDIVFARTGATTGKSFLIESCPIEAVFASCLIRVRIHTGFCVALVAYFFRSADYWQQITENLSGSAQPSCNASKLALLSVPVAPFAEQQRIAAKLDSLLARVHACQQRLDKIPKLLARFRQSVLAAACSGRLSNAGIDGIPNDWETHRLDSLFAVRTGGTPSRKEPRFFVNGSIPWVKTGEVRNGEIFEAAEKITHDAIRNSNATVFPANTLLIAMYGEGKTRGQVGWLRIPAATNQACAALMNEKMAENTREYIFYFLLSQYHKLRAESVGGNQPNLNLGAIKEWELALPPSDEQVKIVLRVRHLLSFADRIEARVATARKRVEALTQSILAKAFRGELVPTEAEVAEAEGREYETASMLLERVKANVNGSAPRKTPRAARRRA